MSAKGKPAIDDIMKMFDLSGGDASSEESSDYSSDAGESKTQKPAFDDLLGDIGDSIGDVSDVPALPLPAPKEKKAKAEPKVEAKPEVKVEAKSVEKAEIKAETPFDQPVKVVQNPEPQVEVKSNEDLIKNAVSVTLENDEVNIDVDDIFSNSASTLKEEVAEDSNVVEEGRDAVTVEDTAETRVSQSEEAKPVSEPEITIEKATKPSPKEPTPFDLPKKTAVKKPLETISEVAEAKESPVVVTATGQINWLLQSPSSKYDAFYRQKADALKYHLLPGGQIPFAKYRAELRNSHVDAFVEGPNTDMLKDRMCMVHGLRERVSQIAIDVNEQFYKWRRFIEMLKGCLARIDYEKPVQRQEGVIFEHMRDMEDYYASLEELHDAVRDIFKNLEAAWETLNRQVTIALGNTREMERFDKGDQRLASGQRAAQDSYNQYKSEKSRTAPIETDNEASAPSDEPKSSPRWDDIDLLGDSIGTEGQSVEVPKKASGSKTVEW